MFASVCACMCVCVCFWCLDVSIFSRFLCQTIAICCQFLFILLEVINHKQSLQNNPFFSIKVFFHKNSQNSTGRGGYFIIPLDYFHPLFIRFTGIQTIAGSSPLHITSSQTLTGKPETFGFPRQVANH